MSDNLANIRVPMDLTNPGQFFACCGLLELADRLWPGAEGWFNGDRFCLRCDGSLESLVKALANGSVDNTMSPAQKTRLKELSAMSKKERQDAGLEEEKKSLDGLRRELPIVFDLSFRLTVDWFCDESSGGSRFKTWAGQQSVLDIATVMHTGLSSLDRIEDGALWTPAAGIGLPFNFDSDLGVQGSPLDVGFSFDPLAASELTRIEVSCKPGLELLAFIGLQRFRPREIARRNRFVYAAWRQPLPPCVAAAAACQAISSACDCYEFRLLYRTKYLKSFLPGVPYRGENNGWT